MGTTITTKVTLLNCLICCNELGDQKPLIAGDNEDGEEEIKEVSKFKRSFKLFFNLLDVRDENQVDEIVDRAITVLKSRYLRSCALSEDGEERLFVGLPCCSDCCGALNDIVKLQEAIDEMKAKQMDHVEGLKTWLMSLNDSRPDQNFWGQIRKQFIACIIKPPVISQWGPPRELRSSRLQSPQRNSSNILRRGKRKHTDASRVSSDLENTTTHCSDLLPTKTLCEDTFEDMSPPSSPLPNFNPPILSGRTKRNQQSEEGRANEIPPKIRPCSVILERIQWPVTNKLESEGIDEEGNHSVLKEEKGSLPSLPTASSNTGKRGNHANHFHLINENFLLNKFSIIKVSHGGSQFSCMEEGCSSTFQNHDWYALFNQMQMHVQSNHVDSKEILLRKCPLCEEEFMETGRKFRKHLLADHSLEMVVCEICWKPMRHVSDNYRVHKWLHKSKQEQEESKEGPPKHLAYNEAKRMERKERKNMSTMIPEKVSPIKNLLIAPKPTPTAMTKLDKATASKPFVESRGEIMLKNETRCGSRHEYRSSRGRHVKLRKLTADDADANSNEANQESDDDFIPATHESDDDSQPVWIPPPSRKSNSNRKSPLVSKSPLRSIKTVLKSANKSTQPKMKMVTVPPPVNPNSRKGSKPNDFFWLINDDTLLYQYTLIQISRGRTQLTCQEPYCSVSFQNINYDALFEDMKEHIKISHPAENAVDEQLDNHLKRKCPHSSCQAELQNLPDFRSHFFVAHSLETVVCEICWKPIRKVAASYPVHKWLHKNDKEKSEATPPRQLIYKAIHSSRTNNNGKRIELLRKLGLQEQNVEKELDAFSKDCGTSTMPNKQLMTPKNGTKAHLDTVCKNECIFQLQDNLLLYKYSLIKIVPGEGLSCQESGCSTIIAAGTDWYAGALKYIKEHVNSCHINCKSDYWTSYNVKSRKCPLCVEDNHYYFRSGFTFRKHLFSKTHSPCPYVCEYCLKPIITKGGIESHTWQHKSAEEKQASPKPRKYPNTLSKKVTCKECGKQFASRGKLRAHAITHLPKSSREHYECNYCSARLMGRVALRNHIERLHRPDLKIFRSCPICDQKFYKRDGYQFRVHLRTHKNEKPFVCETCGMSFAASHQFRLHMKNVHTDERSFQCEFCEMRYKYRGSLKRHKESAHKDKVPVPDKEEKLKQTHYRFRPDFIGPRIAFPCQICEKVFPLRSRMKKHVKLCHLVEFEIEGPENDESLE